MRALVISVVLALTPACDRSAAPPVATTASSSGSAAPPQLGPPPRYPVPASNQGQAAGVHYLEITTGGANLAAELPLVMAIHGLGDRPESFSAVLTDIGVPVRLIFPRGLTEHSGGYSWFPLQGGLRDEETSLGIVAAAGKLAAALTEIARTRPTRGRPIVTGFSQGGALSFAIAVLHPEAVAAAYPVAGWVAFPIPAKMGDGAGLPPLVALHGDADLRIPIAPTRDAVAKLKSAGIPAELREIPGVGHALPEVVRRELKGLITAAIARP